MRLFHYLHNHVYPLRFHFLFAALLCVFVVNIFFPDNVYGGVTQLIYLPFQIFAGVMVFKSKKSVLYMLALVIILLIACRVLKIFFADNLASEMALFYIVFFGGVFCEVLKQIFNDDLTALQILLAGVSGLLLIGYWSSYIFLAINFYQPGSFANLGAADMEVNNIFYFSFITILTVGYGHIIPTSWIAQNATVLVSLLAYIYSWVVIATIVGKATSERAQRKAEEAQKASEKKQ